MEQEGYAQRLALAQTASVGSRPSNSPFAQSGAPAANNNNINSEKPALSTEALTLLTAGHSTSTHPASSSGKDRAEI